MPFTHLHVHTCFSMHDGAADIGALVARARELGMDALAITDHDGLYGAIRFYRACREASIKPIIGAEVILEGGHHLVLLAMNREGYSNLCRLITAAHLSHERDEAPELSWDDLARHSEHLIALSGCSRGEIPAAIRASCRRNVEGRNGCGPDGAPNVPHSAPPKSSRRTGVSPVQITPPKGSRRMGVSPVQIALRYIDLFGRDRFFIELQNHLESPRSGWRAHELARLAEELGLETVATNNVHYVDKDHYSAQDVLVCIKNITTVNVPLPDRKPNAEFYLKSPEEMARLFRDYPEAVRNTERIAEMCDVRLEQDAYHFPRFDVPSGETASSYLRKLCMKGVRELYHPATPAVMERLEHELRIISDLGFAEYFLVVWDIVRFARERGIRCSGRGSAADSLVCYVLRLTDADPMAHANLIFERFMSREHSKMPDIDVDFCSRRRDEVVRYVYDKYGRDHVAAVATVNTYQARSAVREVGKALDMRPDEIDRLAKALPYMGASGIAEAFETVPEVRDADLSLAGKEHLVRICQLISGFPRQLSVHVGGLLITRDSLTDLVPLEWSAKGIVIAQYDKDDVEALGLVKMDILGLRIHSAIADCLEHIERGRGVKLDLERLPLDDEKTFELIRSTNTIGVFQIESPGQRNLLGRTQPKTFEDLIVQISLFRPGPVQGDMITPYVKRCHGEEPVTYPHPALEPVLRATRGVLIYQEQVLQIANVLAGFTPGEADQLRRAMTSDRSSKQMQELRESFISGCLKNGVSRSVAEGVWEQVAAFASFGFCKAHACCFAKLAYQTAYLKAHYPAEFLAGIMTNQPMGFYPPWVVLNEAKRCGIKVLPVDINRSMARYSVEDGMIRVGLAHLKGMSERAMASILHARKHGPFRSLRDFCERTNVPRPIVENLIMVGAFREFERAPCSGGKKREESRKRLLWELAAMPSHSRGAVHSARGPATREGAMNRAPTAPMGPGDMGGTAPVQPSRGWARRESADASVSGRALPPLPGNGKPRTGEFDFGLMESFGDRLPDFGEVSDTERTKHDLDLMGITSDRHPFVFMRESLEAQGVVEAARLREFDDGAPIRVAGMVVSRNRPRTRSGQKVVFVTLEDETGVIEVVIFSNVYDRYGHIIYANPGLIIDGKLSRQGKLDVAVVAERIGAA